MAIREVLKMGDPRLLRVAPPVTAFDSSELRALVQDLFDTMEARGGVGIAAPQIAVNLQVIVFASPGGHPRYPDAPPVPRTVLCNPAFMPRSGAAEDGWEGCLSVPGLRALVPRYRRIRYRGRDLSGAVVERNADGFHARVVQHECDHLRGVLYLMRVRDFTHLGFADALLPDAQMT